MALLEAFLVGYAVQYLMFKRAKKGSTFVRPLPNYLRNPHPMLPGKCSGTGPCFRGPGGSRAYADSEVVAWLRPQLNQCASEQLGASVWLQQGLHAA